MLKQNLEEYDLIRRDMTHLKECMTTFIGYVLGGSGLVFLGLSTLPKPKGTNEPISIALLMLSVIISLVLIVLFYKFNSYNRYAGYCKLLNQEYLGKYDPDKLNNPFMAWELCMDILRESDFNKTNLFKMCNKINIENITKAQIKKELNPIIGPKREKDKYRCFNGIWILFKTIFAQNETKSWQYPLYITVIFLVLHLTFLIGGIGLMLLNNSTQSNALSINWPIFDSNEIFIIILISTILFNGYCWYGFFGKLYMLLFGSATVEAYCWKFLPIRASLIKAKDPTAEYFIINEDTLTKGNLHN